MEVIEMAKTEYICTLEDADLFDDKSFKRMSREHEGKTYYVVLGKKKGSTSTSEQSYRYKKDEWDQNEAKAHCKEHDGTFITVTEENKRVTESKRLTENIIQSIINVIASVDEKEVNIVKQIYEKVSSSDKTVDAMKDNLAYIESLIPDADMFINRENTDIAVQEAFNLFNSITDVDENSKWLLANIIAVLGIHMRTASEIAGVCNKYKDRFAMFKSAEVAFTIVALEVAKKVFKVSLPNDCAKILIGLIVIILKDSLNLPPSNVV
jgi:hypothetical protein